MKRWTILAVLLLVLLAGCRGRGYRPLINTPVLYSDIEFDLLDYLPEEHKTPMVEVFYATNRQHRLLGDEQVRYGNRIDDRVHVGRGQVRLGDEDVTWDQLHQASKVAEREESIPVTLEEVESFGVLQNSLDGDLRSDEVVGDARFADTINAALAASENKLINIYVHGYKVDFDHGAVLAAQFRHFAGRSGVSIAFDWACRQSGLLYLGDVKRARKSIPDLVALVDFLCQETIAESISIISWSAGAPLHSAALTTLRQRHPDWNHEQLYARYKLDKMIFAASDIDYRSFISQYKDFYDLPRSIIITVCEDDGALAMARWVHGHSRLGAPDPAEVMTDELKELQTYYAEKAEIIDVTRSVDLPGKQSDKHHHRYWYNNPWISTDILMSIYLNLPAEQRGLTKDSEYQRVWYFDKDYPQRVIDAWKTVIRQKYRAEELPPNF
ncbi:alpha/beta hydrolase [Planctomycetota bacterium]